MVGGIRDEGKGKEERKGRWKTKRIEGKKMKIELLQNGKRPGVGRSREGEEGKEKKKITTLLSTHTNSSW